MTAKPPVESEAGPSPLEVLGAYIEDQIASGNLREDDRDGLLSYWSKRLGGLPDDRALAIVTSITTPTSVGPPSDNERRYRSLFAQSVNDARAPRPETPDQQVTRVIQEQADALMLTGAEAATITQRVLALGARLSPGEKLERYNQILSGTTDEYGDILRDVLSKAAKAQFDAAWQAQWAFVDAGAKDRGLDGATKAEWQDMASGLAAEQVAMYQDFLQAYLSRMAALSREYADQTSTQAAGRDIVGDGYIHGFNEAVRRRVMDVRDGLALQFVTNSKGAVLQSIGPTGSVRAQAAALAQQSSIALQAALTASINAKVEFYRFYDNLTARLKAASLDETRDKTAHDRAVAALQTLKTESETLLGRYIAQAVPAGVAARDFLNTQVPNLIAPLLPGVQTPQDALGAVTALVSTLTPEEQAAAAKKTIADTRRQEMLDNPVYNSRIQRLEQNAAYFRSIGDTASMQAALAEAERLRKNLPSVAEGYAAISGGGPSASEYATATLGPRPMKGVGVIEGTGKPVLELPDRGALSDIDLKNAPPEGTTQLLAQLFQSIAGVPGQTFTFEQATATGQAFLPRLQREAQAAGLNPASLSKDPFMAYNQVLQARSRTDPQAAQYLLEQLGAGYSSGSLTPRNREPQRGDAVQVGEATAILGKALSQAEVQAQVDAKRKAAGLPYGPAKTEAQSAAELAAAEADKRRREAEIEEARRLAAQTGAR